MLWFLHSTLGLFTVIPLERHQSTCSFPVTDLVDAGVESLGGVGLASPHSLTAGVDDRHDGGRDAGVVLITPEH